MGGEIQSILWPGKGPGIQRASGLSDHSSPFSSVAKLKRSGHQRGPAVKTEEKTEGYLHLSRESTAQSDGQSGLMEPGHFGT